MTLTEGLLATFLSLFPTPAPEPSPRFAPIPVESGLELPLEFSFLDRQAGRLMKVTRESNAPGFSLIPVGGTRVLPKGTIAIKNLERRPTYYLPTSFCLPQLQSEPVLYIVDAARTAGTDYYLTVHGKVIEASGNQLVAEPGLKSIAYAEGRWLMLLSDGSVLQSRLLDARQEYRKLEGLKLPPGAKLTSGEGPKHVAVNGVCPSVL